MWIRVIIYLLGIYVLSASTGVIHASDIYSTQQNSLKKFGIKADGVTDDTAAIQAALNYAAKEGGKLYLPPGRYLVKRSLTIPEGVALRGSSDSPRWYKPLTGTVIFAMHGRGNEDDPLTGRKLSPALFEMGNSTSVSGLTIYYPKQDVKNIRPYSWTFHLSGYDSTVENVTMINSYNGIRVGPENNARHRIKSVYGCVLRRGIFVDYCTDVGRIENVEFHFHWWGPEVGGDFDLLHKYLMENFEFCTFGRTDWQYVTNTFVFEAKTGYRFVKTKNGAASCQMVGVGADSTHTSVLVDGIDSWWTLLITNGQFSSDGLDKTSIGVLINSNPDQSYNGPVRLVNCSILGQQAVVSHSPNLVSLQDCFINTWGPITGNPLIKADNGRLQVTGCNFDSNRVVPQPPQTSIEIDNPLRFATITGNVGASGVKIINNGVPAENTIITNNQPPVF